MDSNERGRNVNLTGLMNVPEAIKFDFSLCSV